jgi:hypothetical protein
VGNGVGSGVVHVGEGKAPELRLWQTTCAGGARWAVG